MNGSLILIADIHLSASFPDRNARFFSFLRAQAAGGCGGVFILGDLFDVWVGDDDDAALAQETTSALAELTAANVPLFIQRGNRDFLLGMRFMRAVSASLLPDAYALLAGGRRFLLMHGDTLTADPGYHRYRRIIRSAPVTAAAMLFSLRRRRGWTAKLRRCSTALRPAAVTLDKTAVIAALRRHRCQTLIHGHLHQTADESWQENGETWRRICLPDWEADGGYVRIDGGELRLEWLGGEAEKTAQRRSHT